MDFEIIRSYRYKEGDINYKIVLKKMLLDSFLSINCQTNNNISFSIRKNLKDLYIEYEWLKCYDSIDKIFIYIENCFYNDKVFINKGMDDSELIIGISLNENNMNDSIIFSLKSESINNVNNNNNIFNYPLNSNYNYYNNNFNNNKNYLNRPENNMGIGINNNYNNNNDINDINRKNIFYQNNININPININNSFKNFDNNNININNNILNCYNNRININNYFDNSFGDNDDNNYVVNNPNNIDTNIIIDKFLNNGTDFNMNNNEENKESIGHINSGIENFSGESLANDFENNNKIENYFSKVNASSIKVKSNHTQFINNISNNILLSNNINNNTLDIIQLINSSTNYCLNHGNININENTNNIINNNIINENTNNILMKIKIFQPAINNNNIIKEEEEEEEKELNGLLNLYFFKLFVNSVEDIDFLCLSEEIKNIFDNIRQKIFLIGEQNHNFKDMIKNNNIYDILHYSDYLNRKKSLIEKEIQNLIEDGKEKKTEILNYRSSLFGYAEFNESFEIQFKKDLKNCKFDYSLVTLNVLERDNPEEYKSRRKDNMIIYNLYHTSNISPESSKIEDELKYPKNLRCAITLTDSIDYLACNLNRSDNNKGKIIPINKYFSLMVSQIFYDENKFKEIKNTDDLDKNEFDHNPSYNELKLNYKDKIVKQNGIHHIKVKKNENNNNLNSSIIENEKVLGNEYLITEKYQIFPFYNLTLKRNEYFVLFYASDFDENNEYFELLEKNIKLALNINIYYEKSIEEALNFLLMRKYNRIILITTIEKDLSGKRFIDIARKILGLEIIVLFYSNAQDNNREHLSWLQNYPNCLYTNKPENIVEYIKNYNINGLKELKKKL